LLAKKKPLFKKASFFVLYVEPNMRYEKTIEYAGFIVVITRDKESSPYKLALDANQNARNYLNDALLACGWCLDKNKLLRGLPVWHKKINGPSQAGLMNSLRESVDLLYRTWRIIEFEELQKERELLTGYKHFEEGN
jgi:hypothetical protein